MANIFVVSDTHFSHAATLHFKRRDGSPLRSFPSVEAMDEFMVEQWNKVVRPQDHVWHLGDVAMRREHVDIVRRLNGHKRLIFGNHDIFDYEVYVKAGFKKLMAYRVFDKMIFSHIPIYGDGLGRFKANIHGHTHDSNVMSENRPDRRYLCVCVEQTNYQPVSLEDIKQTIAKFQ